MDRRVDAERVGATAVRQIATAQRERGRKEEREGSRHTPPRVAPSRFWALVAPVFCRPV